MSIKKDVVISMIDKKRKGPSGGKTRKGRAQRGQHVGTEAIFRLVIAKLQRVGCAP